MSVPCKSIINFASNYILDHHITLLNQGFVIILFRSHSIILQKLSLHVSFWCYSGSFQRITHILVISIITVFEHGSWALSKLFAFCAAVGVAEP